MNDKKIIIRFRGGLGNQMYQYSFAYILSKEFGYENFIFDIREYSNYYWPFDIDKFNIPYSYKVFEVGRLKYDKFIKMYHVYQKLWSIIFGTKPKINKLLKCHNYIFSGTYCDSLARVKNKDIYLYGYFQNALILNKHVSSLYNIFTPKYLSEECIDYCKKITRESILISIRVFANNKGRGNKLQDSSYYLKALNILTSNFSTKRQIVIVSNDIDAVRNYEWIKNYNGDKLFVANLEPIYQIEIMKQCKDFIISNSTFSWWGAFLGSTHNSGTVIAPSTWYHNKKTKKTKILFDNMKVIDG